MLSGKADPKKLATGCPVLPDFDVHAVELENVETLQVLSECPVDQVEQLLPPALHPTLPGVISWSIQRVGSSPWGPFTLAQTRIECRSGVRPRTYLLEARIDNEAALEALAEGWGYRVSMASIRLVRRYDEIRAEVMDGPDPILSLGLRDPEPLGADYVQYVAAMHLAETPAGLRLVQAEPTFRVERAERGIPLVDAFDADAWAVPLLEPAYPVSASFTVGSVTLAPLRFLCRPDVWAFDGTETL